MTHNHPLTPLPLIITPSLHPNLLAELPRFFSGPGQMVQELLQNALQAGATTVDFISDADHLEIHDNGHGLMDPATLITAAWSGWGEEVTDPAGLGVLSVLNPAFCERVTFASQDWRFSVTPAEFAAAMPLDVTQTSGVSGFHVTIDLNSFLDVAALLIAHRGYAPITVRFNGHAVLARRFPEPVPMRVGEFSLGQVHTSWEVPDTGPSEDLTLWEHFELKDENFIGRVRQVAGPLLAAYLSGAKVGVRLSRERGLRPNLPDRRRLQEDAALDTAVQQATEDLTAWLEGHLRAALPDPLPERLEPDALNALQQRYGRAVDMFLHSQGYAPTVDLSTLPTTTLTVGAYRSDARLSGERTFWQRLDRPWSEDTCLETLAGPAALGLPVPLPVTLAGVFDDLPDWAILQTTDDRVLVPVCPRARFSEDLGFLNYRHLVGLSRTLEIAGVDVPFLVLPEDNDTGTLLLLRGTPEEARGTLERHGTLIGGLMLRALFRTDLAGFTPWEKWIGDLDDDETLKFSPDEITALAMRALTDRFLPDLARKAQEREARERRLLTLNRAEHALKEATAAGSVTAAAAATLLDGEIAELRTLLNLEAAQDA